MTVLREGGRERVCLPLPALHFHFLSKLLSSCPPLRSPLILLLSPPRFTSLSSRTQSSCPFLSSLLLYLRKSSQVHLLKIVLILVSCVQYSVASISFILLRPDTVFLDLLFLWVVFFLLFFVLVMEVRVFFLFSVFLFFVCFFLFFYSFLIFLRLPPTPFLLYFLFFPIVLRFSDSAIIFLLLLLLLQPASISLPSSFLQ